MKRLLISILTAIMMLPMTVYAGQWQHDATGYWYQNDDGSYKTGWYQDIDGKWYYLDDANGYVLTNTTTPDGNNVDENGVWIEGGTNTEVYSNKTYDNKAQFSITAISDEPAEPVQLDRALPVTVYYNNKYALEDGREIKIIGMGVSKDGILYAEYSVSEATYTYNLCITTRYVRDDGIYIDEKNRLGNLFSSETVSSGAVMGVTDDEKNVVSVEVFIDNGNLD